MDKIEAFFLTHENITFLEKSMARELSQLMLRSKEPGRIAIDAQAWSSTWQINEECIWACLEKLSDEKFWIIDMNNPAGPYLVSDQVKTTSKAAYRSKKKQTSRSIRALAEVERTDSLTLDCVSPMSFSAMGITIPPEQRDDSLKKGFTGWFPCDKFPINGFAYKPDDAFVESLETEYDELCIATALEMIFREVAYSNKKPSIKAYPYWIKKWLTTNLKKIPRKEELKDISSLIESKLDEY